MGTEEAAKFSKKLLDVEGTETDTVKMICEVSKASAEVTWHRGEEELPEVGRYEQIVDGRKRILIIKGLKMEDAGKYNCRLSPDMKTSAELKVNGKKSISGASSAFNVFSLCLFERYVRMGILPCRPFVLVVRSLVLQSDLPKERAELLSFYPKLIFCFSQNLQLSSSPDHRTRRW